MKSKVTNFLLLPSLTLSCGILVILLFPNRGKTAVLVGSTTGSMIGAYYLIYEEDKKTSSKLNSLSPQQRLSLLQDQVTVVQTHLRYLSDDLNHYTYSPYTSVSAYSELTQPQHIIASDEVINWLVSQGIKVQNYHKPTENEEVFNKLATYLGDKYIYLNYFYNHLKRSFSKGRKLALNLGSRTKIEITCTTQFCHQMKNYAFLASYQYDRKNKMLYASPQQTGLVINFVTGGWFERFIYLSLCQLFQKQRWSYYSVLNPQVILKNKEDFELDILFLIEEKPFWVECKTGDYQAHVTKYSKMRSVLSIPKECSLLVILGISDQLTQELTGLHDIYVANEKNFLSISKGLISSL